MSRIRSKDTQPELRVRKYLHAAGLRYRLHGAALPGKPDLVFASRRLCVFINGCFWHGCMRCTDGLRRPKTNRTYWLPKISRNKARDKRNIRRLREAGWKVLTIWECEICKKKLEKLRRVIEKTRQRKPSQSKGKSTKRRRVFKGSNTMSGSAS